MFCDFKNKYVVKEKAFQLAVKLGQMRLLFNHHWKNNTIAFTVQMAAVLIISQMINVFWMLKRPTYVPLVLWPMWSFLFSLAVIIA